MRAFYLLFFCFPVIVFSQTQFDAIQQMFVQKQFVKAQEVMVQYVSSNPSDLKGIELLGDAYGHQKKWDEALIQYKKLVELDPNNANYHYKCGGVLGMKALEVSKIKALPIIGDAKSSFLKAAELDPNHIDVRWALVELYMKLPGIIGGSKSKSLHYADELELISKVDGYLAKGYIYETDDQYELAESYYKKAIVVGGSINCYDKLTKFYEKNDQPKKAIANLEASKEKHKYNLFNYEIGKVAAKYNVELEKGIESLKVYIKNYSGEDVSSKAWAHYRLAQIYKHKNEKGIALEYIDLAISELPNIKPFEEEKVSILNLK